MGDNVNEQILIVVNDEIASDGTNGGSDTNTFRLAAVTDTNTGAFNATSLVVTQAQDTNLTLDIT